MATVYKGKPRKRDGVTPYRIQVYLYKDEKGKTHYAFMSWDKPPNMTEHAAKRELQKVISDFEMSEREKMRQAKVMDITAENQRNNDIENITFSQYAERWLVNSRNSGKALSTIAKAEKAIEMANGFIGSLRMKALTPLDFDPILNYLNTYQIVSKKGKLKRPLDQILKGKVEREVHEKAGIADTTLYFAKSGRTVEWWVIEAVCKVLNIDPICYFEKDFKTRNYANESKLSIKRVTNTIMNHAVKRRVIPYNPAQVVFSELKKVKTKKKMLQPNELKSLYKAISAIGDIRIKSCIALLIFTGMRRGEVCGLEWKHIDLVAETITIEQSATQLKGQYITKSPKTECSVRTIHVASALINILRECKAWYDNEKSRLGDYWQDSDRVIVRHNGEPINPSTIATWLRKILADNNLPQVGCHSLRHTNLSLQMNNAGLSAREVADYAGHADPELTLNVYAHSFNESHKKAAMYFDNFFAEDNVITFQERRKV